MQFKNNTYFSCGAFSHCIITCQSLATYDQAQDSTHQYPHPYPSPAHIALHMETGEDWYTNTSHNLYLVDLLFQAHIQTAHRMSQQVDHFPNQDRVLECLMAESLFDCCELDYFHITEM